MSTVPDFVSRLVSYRSALTLDFFHKYVSSQLGENVFRFAPVIYIDMLFKKVFNVYETCI